MHRLVLVHVSKDKMDVLSDEHAKRGEQRPLLEYVGERMIDPWNEYDERAYRLVPFDSDEMALMLGDTPKCKDFIKVVLKTFECRLGYNEGIAIYNESDFKKAGENGKIVVDGMSAMKHRELGLDHIFFMDEEGALALAMLCDDRSKWDWCSLGGRWEDWLIDTQGKQVPGGKVKNLQLLHDQLDEEWMRAVIDDWKEELSAAFDITGKETSRGVLRSMHSQIERTWVREENGKITIHTPSTTSVELDWNRYPCIPSMLRVEHLNYSDDEIIAYIKARLQVPSAIVQDGKWTELCEGYFMEIEDASGALEAFKGWCDKLDEDDYLIAMDIHY